MHSDQDEYDDIDDDALADMMERREHDPFGMNDSDEDDYGEFDDDALADPIEDRELDRLKRDMGLCPYCMDISERFFDRVPKGYFSPADRSYQFVYQHNTANGIRRAAKDGCPMCWTLARMLNDEWLDSDMKEKERLFLKRGIIDPEQSIAMFRGMDDISHNIFHVAPKAFSRYMGNTLATQVTEHTDTALPLHKLHEPVEELQLMTQWLTDCCQSHIICDKKAKIFIPTRLLDLRTLQDSNDILLVEPPQDWPSDLYGPIMYTALSHCWGATPNPVKTTKANYRDRSKRIAYSELPLTFQHAVTITRRLEIPYLWIDSLCIIQDSAEDWAKEVETMGRVYGGSTCTLAAMGSADSNGGFPLERGGIDGFDLPFRNKRVRIYVAEPNSWAGGMHGPLLSRAWTFQERNLSIRTIHFSRETLLWECKTSRASPELPWMQAKPYDADPAPRMICDSSEEADALMRLGRSKRLDRRSRWFSIAEQYSRRNLTFGKDKLPALSGLAQNFAEEQSLEGYAAGLWKDDMPSALLWMVIHDSRSVSTDDPSSTKKRGEYRAPTWSWMSMDGEIDYGSLTVDFDSRVVFRPSSWDFGHFHVHEARTSPVSKDKTGQISSGSLEVSGCLQEAFVGQAFVPDRLPYGGFRHYKLQTSDGTKIGILLPDIWSEVREGQSLRLVSIRAENSDSTLKMPEDLYGRRATEFDDQDNWMHMGLALTKHESEKGTYKRVGMVRWVKTNHFAGVKPSRIVIL